MNKEEILQAIATLKPLLKKEGITLLGVFGSFARGDYHSESDVDILYDIDNPKAFSQKFGGFAAFTKLEEFKKMIAERLGRKVDFVAKNGLNSISKKYVMRDLLYV